MVEQMLKLRAEGWSYPAIGKRLKRDRTTVMWWINKLGKGGKMPILAEDKDIDIWGRKKNIPKPAQDRTPISYEQVVAEAEKKKRQRECQHRAGVIVNGRCWLCKFIVKPEEI